MTGFRIIAVIFLAIFLTSISGYCLEHACHDEDGGDHRCAAFCHAGCCSAILPTAQYRMTLGLLSSIEPIKQPPLQTVFIDGVKHPPKELA